MDQTSSTDPDQAPLDLVRRPPGQLHDYPLEVRWEVTRRHPYYLVFWSQALLYHQNNLGNSPEERLFRQATFLMLGSIGVTGQPIDPAISSEELLGTNPDPAFLTGSVQPMTLRSIIAMLINVLPQAECTLLGALLMSAGHEEYAEPDDDPQGVAQKGRRLNELARIPSTALDSCAEAPLFYIHLDASQRSICRDVEDQVRRWKQRRNIIEHHVHTDKLQPYLDVWDRREGWVGNGYERSQEQTFKAIAQQLRLPLSTIVNRYRSAFNMIVGHPFQPELWWRLFGPLKYGQLCGDPETILSVPTRRLLRSPIPREVPDSVVSPNREQAHASSTVERGSAVANGIDLIDLRIDLENMF